MGSECLIIVDMQNDFFATSGAYYKGEVYRRRLKPVVENICRIIPLARKRMKLVYLRAAYGPDRSGCQEGTWGSEFIDPIKTLIDEGPHEVVVKKHTFDGFFETPLGELLKQWEVNTVLVAGVETDVCVSRAAEGAVIRGFTTIILEDCVATPDGVEVSKKDFFDKRALTFPRSDFEIKGKLPAPAP